MTKRGIRIEEEIEGSGYSEKLDKKQERKKKR